MQCKHCQQERKNANSLRNHERLCKNNPDRQHTPFQNAEWQKEKAANRFTKAKNLGLPPPEVSKETREKLSKAATIQNQTQWTDAAKSRQSNKMKEVVAKNPDSYSKKNVSGRVNQIEYNGIVFKGSWEVRFAKWCDDNNILYIYEPEPLQYQYRGQIHSYFPDFQLENGLYVEVKGYITERDIAKWDGICDNICIVTKNEIEKIKRDTYTKNELRPIGERVHALLS